MLALNLNLRFQMFKMVLFQQMLRKRMKEYSFNLRTEIDIVEDALPVILPVQLTF